MEQIQTFISFIQGLGFSGLLIILAVPRLRKLIFNGDTSGLKEQIDNIGNNHVHEVGQKVDKSNNYLIKLAISMDNANKTLERIERKMEK